MKDERRYTISINSQYRSDSIVWWILEVDMASAVHLGFNIFRADVADRSSGKRTMACIRPMTLGEAYDFIQARLIPRDWVDMLYLNGTRVRSIEGAVLHHVKGTDVP